MKFQRSETTPVPFTSISTISQVTRLALNFHRLRHSKHQMHLSTLYRRMQVSDTIKQGHAPPLDQWPRTDWSAFTAHASMPPRRLFAVPNPFSFSSLTAAKLLLPTWQYATTGTFGSSSFKRFRS